MGILENGNIVYGNITNTNYQSALRKADQYDGPSGRNKTIDTSTPDAKEEVINAAKNISDLKEVTTKYTANDFETAKAYLFQILGVNPPSENSVTTIDYDVYVNFDTDLVGYWYAFNNTIAGIKKTGETANKGYKILSLKDDKTGGIGVDTNKGNNTIAKNEGKITNFSDFAIKGKGYNTICLELIGEKLPNMVLVEVETYDGEKTELTYAPEKGINPGIIKINANEYGLDLNDTNISKLQIKFSNVPEPFYIDNIGFGK